MFLIVPLISSEKNVTTSRNNRIRSHNYIIRRERGEIIFSETFRRVMTIKRTRKIRSSLRGRHRADSECLYIQRLSNAKRHVDRIQNASSINASYYFPKCKTISAVSEKNFNHINDFNYLRLGCILL